MLLPKVCTNCLSLRTYIDANIDTTNYDTSHDIDGLCCIATSCTTNCCICCPCLCVGGGGTD
jgi:hypothetical protein